MRAFYPFDYSGCVPPEGTFDSLPVTPGCTIGQMVRSAIETGVTPDMPAPELGNDDDAPDGYFDPSNPASTFADPYGDIRTDWSVMAEYGMPRAFRPGTDGFTAPVNEAPQVNTRAESETGSSAAGPEPTAPDPMTN